MDYTVNICNSIWKQNFSIPKTSRICTHTHCEVKITINKDSCATSKLTSKICLIFDIKRNKNHLTTTIIHTYHSINNFTLIKQSTCKCSCIKNIRSIIGSFQGCCRAYNVMRKNTIPIFSIESFNRKTSRLKYSIRYSKNSRYYLWIS